MYRHCTLLTLIFAALGCAWPAYAQEMFHRTKTVDPTNTTWSDFNSIQAAIDDVPSDDHEKWTILIFAGTYNEAVELNETKENVDLVGIDRDAVIIAPSSGDGVTITSGTESARNNTIRNLTIRTTGGHGVRIVKGDAPVPKSVTLDGVTIRADGADKDAVHAAVVDFLTIRNCSLESDDAAAIRMATPGGSTWHDLTIDSTRAVGATDALSGLFERLTVTNSSLIGGQRAVRLIGRADVDLSVSGQPDCSRWPGALRPGDRSVASVQRTVNVSAPSGTAILGAQALTSQEQEITSNLGQPDVYRTLSATGNQIGMNQNVYIIGADFAGNRIAEKLTLSGSTPVRGNKPFRTVTKVMLPAQSGSNQTVSIGTTSKLGLYFPVSAAADVLQQGRKSSAANSYTLESVGTVDAVYATVDVASITSGDSFEWTVLASD